MTQNTRAGSGSVISTRPLQVFQAIYGERDRGHGLLSASDPGIPAAEIIPFTDRPESAPATMAWAPYLRGFVWNSWYILARTFPDPSSTRAGMVFTHALFVRFEDLPFICRLDRLIGLLMPAVPKVRALDSVPLQYDDCDRPASNAQDTLSPKTASLAAALLKVSGTPVVWVGQEGFECSLRELWSRIWPSARALLQFGLVFAPQDLEGQQLSVVATPRPLASRWAGYQLVDIAQPLDPMQEDPLLAAALAYVFSRQGHTTLTQFFADIEVAPTSFTDVALAARVLPLMTTDTENAGASAEALRSQARVVGKLSPDPNAGSAYKERLMNRLAERTSWGGDEDVIGLRNFDFAPFRTGAAAMSSAINVWFGRAVSTRASPGPSVLEPIRDSARVILLADGEGVWAKMVRAAVGRLLSSWSRDLAERVWTWIGTDVAVIERAADQIPASAGESLADTCPLRLSIVASTAVLQGLAIPRGWDTLAAAVLCAAHPPSEAYALLRQSSALATGRAYATIAKRVPAISTVEAAVAADDIALCGVAGKLCAADPALLHDLDASNSSWVAIWDASVQISNDVWRGINNPVAARDRVLAAVVAGNQVPQSLLHAIATSSHASLLDNEQRPAIWSTLPQGARTLFLSATADDWLNRWLSRAHSGSLGLPSDSYLRTDVASDRRVRRALQSASGETLSQVVTLLEVLPGFTESVIQDWIRGNSAVARSASSEAAQALGRLINARGWRGAALEVSKLASQYPGSALRATVQACAHLLPLWRRIHLWDWLPQTGTMDDDPWTALTELAIQLYPWGPGEYDVWQRAGGDPSRLPNRSTGRESWHASITLIRNGGGGEHLSGHRLITTMLEDFQQKEELRLLLQLPPFRSPHR